MSGVTWNTLTLQSEGEKVENFLTDADVASVIFDMDAGAIKQSLFGSMAKFEKFAGIQVRCFELLQDCHLLAPPGITNDEIVPRYDAILRTLSSWIGKVEVVQNIFQLLSMVADREVLRQRAVKVEEHELLYYVNRAIALHHSSKPLQRAALQLFEAVIENASPQAFTAISSRIFKPVLDNLLLNADDTSICFSSFSILNSLAGHAQSIIAPWIDQIINLALGAVAKQMSGEVTSKCLLLLQQITADKDALLTVAGHERGLMLFVDALAALRPQHLRSQAVNLDLCLRVLEDYDIATIAFQSIGDQDPLDFAVHLRSSLKDKFDRFLSLCGDEERLDEQTMQDVFLLYSQVDLTLEEMIKDVPTEDEPPLPPPLQERAREEESDHPRAAILAAVEGEEGEAVEAVPAAAVAVAVHAEHLLAMAEVIVEPESRKAVRFDEQVSVSEFAIDDAGATDVGFFHGQASEVDSYPVEGEDVDAGWSRHQCNDEASVLEAQGGSVVNEELAQRDEWRSAEEHDPKGTGNELDHFDGGEEVTEALPLIEEWPVEEEELVGGPDEEGQEAVPTTTESPTVAENEALTLTPAASPAPVSAPSPLPAFSPESTPAPEVEPELELTTAVVTTLAKDRMTAPSGLHCLSEGIERSVVSPATSHAPVCARAPPVQVVVTKVAATTLSPPRVTRASPSPPAAPPLRQREKPSPAKRFADNDSNAELRRQQLVQEHAAQMQRLALEKKTAQDQLQAADGRALAAQMKIDQLRVALKTSQEQTARALDKAGAMHHMFRDAALKIEALVLENERVWTKLRELQVAPERDAPSPIAIEVEEGQFEDLSAALSLTAAVEENEEEPRAEPAVQTFSGLGRLSPLDGAVPLAAVRRPGLSPFRAPKPLAAQVPGQAPTTPTAASALRARVVGAGDVLRSAEVQGLQQASRRAVEDSKLSVATAGALEALQQFGAPADAAQGAVLDSARQVAQRIVLLFNALVLACRRAVTTESAGAPQPNTLPLRALRSCLDALGLVPASSDGRRVELLLAQFRAKSVTLFGAAFTLVLCGLERFLGSAGTAAAPQVPDALQKLETVIDKHLTSRQSQVRAGDAVNPLDAAPTLSGPEFEELVRLLEREKRPLLALFAAYTPWIAASPAPPGRASPPPSPLRSMPTEASPAAVRRARRVSEAPVCERFAGAGAAGNRMRWQDALCFAKDFAVSPTLLSFSQLHELFRAASENDHVEAQDDTALDPPTLSFAQFADFVLQCALRCPLFRGSSAPPISRLASFFSLLNQSPGRNLLARRNRSGELVVFRPHETAPVHRTANFARNGQLPVATAVAISSSSGGGGMDGAGAASSASGPSARPRKKSIEELRDWIVGSRS